MKKGYKRGRISSDGGALDCRARGGEFVSWGWTNTQVLKYLRNEGTPLHCKRLALRMARMTM